MGPDNQTSYADAPRTSPGPSLPPLAKDEPAASQAFRRLTNNIGELDACLADLISRINPVLSPQASDEPGMEPHVPGSVITNMINTEADRVQSLINTVNDVFRRVEV